MNKDLEKLLDLAFADGILTDKEKQVLYKKAKELGVDKDEFEMVLEARLYLEQKEKTDQQVKSNKYGDVKKCPSCGAITETLSLKCNDCGYEYRNTENSQTSLKLNKALENIDKEEKRARIIKDFPVPNNKEDLFEILALATSHLNKPSEYFDENNYTSEETVWYLKSKQTIEKLKLLIPDDKKIKGFEEKIKAFEKQKKIAFISTLKRIYNGLSSDTKMAVIVSVLLLVGVTIFLGVATFSHNKEISRIRSEEKTKKDTQLQMEEALNHNNFAEAKKIALQLDVLEKYEAQGRIYKAEMLFYIDKKDLKGAEDVFFSCPRDAYYYCKNAAPNIVQGYLENNNRKGATSFVNKVDVDYDGGELKKQLKALLK